MTSKTVLVTGGSGLVGKAIEKVISLEKPQDEKWIFLNSSMGDLRNEDETRRIFDLYRPSHVVHLAAKVGGLFNNMRNNLEFFTMNMLINDNVLKLSHETGVNKVVSCMSTCIFPDKTPYPIDETMIHNGPPHSSNYGYSYAKRMIDVLNHGYRDDHGRNYTSVIPCNIFGPHDNFSLEDGHVIPSLIRRLENTILSREDQFVVYGSGKPLRQFIYSIDVAKLIIYILRNYDDVEPIILSVDERDEVSIADAAAVIAKAFKFQGDIVFDTTKADGQYKKTASNAKLRKLLPKFEFTPFEQAINETVRWFKSNYHIVRLE